MNFKLNEEKNDSKVNPTNNDGKSVAAERFIRTLKSKIYKYMTSRSINFYTDKLDDIFKNTTMNIIELLT